LINHVCFVDCSKYENRTKVRIGSLFKFLNNSDVQEFEIDRIINRTDYKNLLTKRDVLINDIALLHLSAKVVYTDTVRPICLPPPNVNLDQFKVCVASGFGSTTTDNGKYFNNFSLKCTRLYCSLTERKSFQMTGTANVMV